MDVSVPRPNPFAVPSGTLIRFILLIVAASTAALGNLSQHMSTALGVPSDDVVARDLCAQEKVREAIARRQADLNDTTGAYGSIWECYEPRSDVAWWPNGLALVLFWLLVLLVYWYLPRWRIRRRRLHSLDAKLFPELSSYLIELQREAGVRQRVTYLLEPLNPKVAALAFGRINRRYIMLSGGLVALFTRDPSAFRVVVLHELAHVRNRDLDITFIAITVWRLVAFLLFWQIITFPLSVGVVLSRLQVAPEKLSYLIPAEAATIVQTILMAVFVPLMRNAVLRSRELYADARTVQWNNSVDDLRYLFKAYSNEDRRPRGALRFHPPLKNRITSLANALDLFAIGFWEALSIGIMVTLAIHSISDFLDLPSSAGSLTGDVIAVLVAALLLAAGVGFGVWRETVRSFVTRAPMRVNAAGFGLGFGLVLGAAITPTTAVFFYITQTSPFGILAPALILLFVSGLVIVRWIALVARCWMPVLVNRNHPLRTILGTLISISIPLAIWLGFCLVLPLMAMGVKTTTYPHQSGVAVFFLVLAVMVLGLSGPVMIPLLLTLSLIPLIGVASCRHPAVGNDASRWISLDPLPADWLPPRPHSELRTAIRVGWWCAISGTGLAILSGAVITLGLGIADGAAVMTGGVVFIASLTQVIAAVVASARTRYLRSLHGIVAAFLAGSAILLINFTGWRLVAWVSQGKDIRNPSLSPVSWTTAVLSLGIGMLAAAPVALITAKLAYVIRTRTRPSSLVGTREHDTETV